MERSQLRNMIDSGRAIAMDCHAISCVVPDDDPIGKMFKTSLMNNAVLMQRYEPAPEKAQQAVKVSTVVYFPYDLDNVYDGGESLDFNGDNFHEALSLKIAKGNASADLEERLIADMEALNLLNDMHSLDPFMFKCKAEQREVDAGIHNAYFAISPAEWDKIRIPIRDKIQTLVSKALGTVGSDEKNQVRQNYVENFLQKIWEAKDIEGIEPFINAMQLEAERAPGIFFAWKAVCYYQVQFMELLQSLKVMFQWAGHNQLCFPVDHISLKPEDRRQIEAKRDLLREKMRDSYIIANKVLRQYEHSYNQFVQEDRPQTFMSFLENAENSYLLLASHVSTATHSTNLWKWYIEQYGPEMRHAQFAELFDGLNMLYDVELTPAKANELVWA